MSLIQASNDYSRSIPWAHTAPNMQTSQFYSYPQTSTTQLSPDSDAQSTSSDESSQSACSVASSQTSISSQESWQTEVESDPCEPIGKPICVPAQGYALSQAPQVSNPRRTSRDQVPPSLSRQHERKSQFVLHLVDSATCLVETIWPTSSPVCHAGAPLQHGTLPLRTFIEETLRRSKTSFSTLQVALFYIILLKDHLPAHDFTMQQPKDDVEFRALQCGRRMFLAALILGSKYLQDRNYSARAWSKISGLRVCEINLNEKALLAAVSWKLHIPEPTFNRWQDILIKYSQPSMVSHWQQKIPELTAHYVANYYPSSAVLETIPISNFWATQQNSVDRVGAMSWTSNVAMAACRPDTGYQAQPNIPPSAFKLTTPSPMSSICPTPAASVASDMLRNTCRPGAMRSAMSMVSNAANVRSCVDRRPAAVTSSSANRLCRWRSPSSITSRSNSDDQVSSSVASSPGSMISDYGSSRSSSVSSVSIQSKDTSPIRNRLPRLASRNAMHKYVDMSAAAASVTFDDCVTVLDSEPLTGNNFMRSPEVIVMEDDATPVQYSFDATRDSRKRHRNSVDSVASSDLQDSVRRLMRQKPAFEVRPTPTIQRKNSYGMGKPAAKKPCYTNESLVLDDIVTLDGPHVWKTPIY